MNLRGRRRLAISPGKRAGVVLMLLTLVIAASAAIAQVWTQLRAIEYGYSLSKATRVQAKLREHNRRLRVELQLLKSPARVARIARGELGLRSPEPEQIRYVRFPEDGFPADFLDTVAGIMLKPEAFADNKAHNKSAVRLRYSMEMIEGKFDAFIDTLGETNV